MMKRKKPLAEPDLGMGGHLARPVGVRGEKLGRQERWDERGGERPEQLGNRWLSSSSFSVLAR